MSTVLATPGSEEMQDKMVMPGERCQHRSPLGWVIPCGSHLVGGRTLLVGRGGMGVKRVMGERGQAVRPLWWSETCPRQQHAQMPGHRSVFLRDSAFSNSIEGRWVLPGDHPWQCPASSCAFPGMASRCAEVEEIICLTRSQ